jgi:hypothetical protein
LRFGKGGVTGRSVLPNTSAVSGSLKVKRLRHRTSGILSCAFACCERHLSTFSGNLAFPLPHGALLVDLLNFSRQLSCAALAFVAPTLQRVELLHQCCLLGARLAFGLAHAHYLTAQRGSAWRFTVVIFPVVAAR